MDKENPALTGRERGKQASVGGDESRDSRGCHLDNGATVLDGADYR